MVQLTRLHLPATCPCTQPHRPTSLYSTQNWQQRFWRLMNVIGCVCPFTALCKADFVVGQYGLEIEIARALEGLPSG